jgi:hypothetical protein
MAVRWGGPNHTDDTCDDSNCIGIPKEYWKVMPPTHIWVMTGNRQNVALHSNEDLPPYSAFVVDFAPVSTLLVETNWY